MIKNIDSCKCEEEPCVYKKVNRSIHFLGIISGQHVTH